MLAPASFISSPSANCRKEKKLISLVKLRSYADTLQFASSIASSSCVFVVDSRGRASHSENYPTIFDFRSTGEIQIVKQKALLTRKGTFAC